VLAWVLIRSAPVEDRQARPNKVSHLQAGKAALAAGRYRFASQELALARQELDSNAASPSRTRQLAHLGSEAALLADLVPVPLEEILRQAIDLNIIDPQEWRAVFAERYQGKSLVFDAPLRRVGEGQYALDYALFCKAGRAVIDLDQQEAFAAVPLAAPQRVLVGLRLADIRLGAEGVWVVRFQSDSAHFLTNSGAAAACCLVPADDLTDVLQRQARWVAEGR
jgi:hypothetical protein